jgi:hypothetical protein
MHKRNISGFWEILRNTMLVGCFLGALATSFEAAAARRFEMALFSSSDPTSTDLSWIAPCTDQPSAPRRSILVIDGNYENSQLASVLATCNYDWSRIAAVVIDEPYWWATGATNWTNPCYTQGSDERWEQLWARDAALQNAAAAVQNISPSTRFWVNFSEPEVKWMQDSNCPLPLRSFIDVISLDKYNVPFSQVQPYYNWIVAHRSRPQQQLALVPGVFHQALPTWTNPSIAAGYLQAYFNYANSMNSTPADLPMVWLVAGWPGLGDDWNGDVGNGYVWHGIFHPTSYPILNAWNQQFAQLLVDRFWGHVDVLNPSTMVVSGWAVDRTMEMPPYVDFWVDGQYWGTTVANQSRPDVGAIYGIEQAGFTFNIPAHRNDGRCHNMQVWAVSPTAVAGNNFLIVNRYFCF